MGRLAMRWRELPVNWVSNQWFEHKRLFDKGPFSRFDVTVEFEGLRFGGATKAATERSAPPASISQDGLLRMAISISSSTSHDPDSGPSRVQAFAEASRSLSLRRLRSPLAT